MCCGYDIFTNPKYIRTESKKLDVLTTVVDFLIFVIIYLLVKLLFNFNFKFWAHKY
ncbi:hypothetical protein C8C85_3144 [Flavobacterium sp. 103]|nr:hypothetical protein C8C85_3144 [Flavobacterium sp. 103]